MQQLWLTVKVFNISIPVKENIMYNDDDFDQEEFSDYLDEVYDRENG